MTLRLQAAVSEIEMMKGRVSRLLNVSQCLESSAYQDIGVEQRDQLTAMLSELDAMRLTCNDRMLLSDPNLPPVHYAVCPNTYGIVQLEWIASNWFVMTT